MPLGHIQIRHFRNLRTVDLDFNPRLNLIYGDNASGKTSLLEAIYLLSSGRSFRSNRIEHLRQQGEDGFSVRGTKTGNGTGSELLIRQQGNQRKISIDGIDDTRIADMARALPCLFISPEGHHELLHDSQLRRSALDWLVFHVEPEFQALWSRYRRLLKQRNAALKARNNVATIQAWDAELASTGEAIHELRSATIPPLQQILIDYAAEFQFPGAVTLQYDAGWDPGLGLKQSLQQDQERDLVRGHTGSGPHRADINILVDGERLQHIASHGQQRLLIVALRFAQLHIFQQRLERECLLLFDDLSSELDRHFQKHILRLISDLDVQTFITATERQFLEQFEWPEYALFHVEHGSINAAK